MATLTTKITLSSTDALTDTLSVTTEDSLSIGNPTEFSRKIIATGSAQSVIASNSSFSYVYLKVVSSDNAAAWVQVLLGGHAKFKMKIGEFAFFPWASTVDLFADAATGTPSLEVRVFEVAIS